jgi:hypothetical protein
VVVLIDATTWPGLVNTYDYFTFPAAMFYERVLLGHVALLHIALLRVGPDRLVEAGILLTASVFALVGGRPRTARWAAATMGVALVALCAAQALYGLRKFTTTAGEANGPDAGARSWVDRHVPSAARVGALGVSMGETTAYLPIWRATEFWNTSVQLDVFFGNPAALPLPLGSETRRLTVGDQDGLLRASGASTTSPALVPRYLLVPRQGTNRVGLDARPIAADPYLPLDLVRLSQPARIDWSLSGTSPEGFLTPGQPATATVYSGALAGRARRCATFSLIAPPGFSGRRPYRVSAGGRLLARGTLAALQTVPVTVPLSPRATPRGPSAGLAVEAAGGTTLANGLTVTTKLAFFAVSGCPGSG